MNTSPDATTSPHSFYRQALAKAPQNAAYLLLQAPVHLVIFVLVLPTLLAGVGTAIIGIGIAMMIASIMIARLAAELQRTINATIQGRPMPEYPYLVATPTAKARDKTLTLLKDPQSWLDIIWVIAGFPIALITWVVALIWSAAPIAGVITPFLELVDIYGGWSNFNSMGLGELLGVPYPNVFDAGFAFSVGLLFAASAPFVLRGCTLLLTAFSDLMLSSRARQRRNIEHLTESRAAARDAETRSLRRLERDLHDGPQQRLVRLQMDLARAKRRVDTDPKQASLLLEEALQSAQETLSELRQLSRGIAPPVLVDRGLTAAVDEAAALSTVPVSVHALGLGTVHIPEHVATAAYFTVAEALVNVNKHADASAAQVTMRVEEGALRVTIADNGVGGAALSKGYGLAGIEQRLRAVDGRLTLNSPQGGPTVVEAIIPCAS